MNLMFPNEINKYLENNNLHVRATDERPWGAWYLIYTSNNNDQKIIEVAPHKALSLQYHGSVLHPGHNEMWFAATDIRAVCSTVSAVIDLKGALQNLTIIDVQAGGTLVVPGGFIHALVNPSQKNLFLIETRTSQRVETPEQREENITRIYDQALRIGTELFPEDLYARMMSSNPAPLIVASGESLNLADINPSNL